MAICQYHRNRAGVGVCMRCRAVICQECCTRVDGVNHCHQCLQALGQKAVVSQGGGIPMSILAAAVLGVTWLFFLGVTWLVHGRLAP
jgi:hypothetical protein